MNRRVTYKTLWLVSARDESARKQLFSQKTLLLGPNGTGKSRVVKNLYWVFGCKTRKRDAGTWDPDTVAALEFTYRDNDYMVVRDGKRLGMFGADDHLLFSAENMSAWSKELGAFFGFELRLKRPQTTAFSQAGPEYMFMPFYMDQDGSWGAGWETFEQLTQFSEWKGATFESFIGMRPNAYFQAKYLSTEIGERVSERRKELEAQRSAFKRVQDVLPKNLPSLNFAAFRSELAELGRKATKLQQEQVRIRGQLLGLVNTREKVLSELKIALSAYNELKGDFSYLTDRAGEAIECPTCGTVHENSFHARILLSSDTESLGGLIMELRTQADDLSGKEANFRGSLRLVERSIAELDKLQQERRAKLKLEEVLASQSKRTLDTAFQRVSGDLSSAVKKLETEKAKADAEVKKYEDPERLVDVRTYFSAQVSSLSNLVDVPLDEQIGEPKPGARAQSGGSSAPRSMLAVHLAMLATNAEWGDSPLFPFVVDTPQQSGQDDPNLTKMVEVLGRAAGVHHQVILAAERLPVSAQLGDFNTVELVQKRAILSKEIFAEAVERIQGPLAALRESLKSAADSA
jgi:phage host-nuclease inhibitor protein Gam